MSAPCRVTVSMISRKVFRLWAPSRVFTRCRRCSIALMRSQMQRMIMTSCMMKSDKSLTDSSSSSDDSSSDDSDSEIDQTLTDAVKSVASSLSGDPKKTESDLLRQLRTLSKGSDIKADSDVASQAGQSLGDLFAGMRISTVQKQKAQDLDERPWLTRHPHSGEEYKNTQEQFRRRDFPQKEQATMRRRTQQIKILTVKPEKLFQGPGLNIFSRTKKAIPETVEAQSKEESLWDIIDREEEEKLKPPVKNAFEEMIKWTEEGKLWTFPINNEAGMDEEENVEFHEHVFLDRHIEDFPKRGPVRHFMELVLTGLSKNPYMTAQMKREHIDWFRQYFKDKKEIIKENIGQESLIQETTGQ